MLVVSPDVPERLQDVLALSVLESSDVQERLPDVPARSEDTSVTVANTDVMVVNTDVTDARDVDAQRKPDVPLVVLVNH